MDGWIRLYRRLLEDGWYLALTDAQARAWVHLLLLVNWKESEWCCHKCSTQAILPAGATAKTFRTLAQRAHVGEHVMRKLLEKALRAGKLEVLYLSGCHKVYLVVNWQKYQEAVTTRSQSGHDAVTEWSHEEEGKKERREQTTTPAAPPPVFPLRALEAAGWLHGAILAWKPDHRLSSHSASQKDAWEHQQAPHLDKLNRLDGVNWERISAVLRWLPGDDFWPANIQSGAKFRAKFDTLEAKMRKPPAPPPGPPKKSVGPIFVLRNGQQVKL